MTLDPRQASRAARAGLLVGIPLALVLGAAGITRAFDASSGWTGGEVLTAADLNALVARLNGVVTGLTAQSASVDALAAEVTALKAQVASLKADAAMAAAAPFGPEFVTSTSDQATDLGDQLNALLAQHRNVRLTLARGVGASVAEYRWNTRVVLPAGSRLIVVGEGYGNFAEQLGVRILMDVALSLIDGDKSTRRAPARLVALDRSEFLLRGVHVRESGNSTLDLTLQCTLAAIFTFGEGALVTLDQIRIVSTEDILNPHERAFGHVRFGHTYIDKLATATRTENLYPVAAGPTWCWSGGGAVVSSVASTTLGAGVAPKTSWPVNYVQIP